MNHREANFVNIKLRQGETKCFKPRECQTLHAAVFGNSSLADMRRFVNAGNPTSMKQVFKAAKEYEEENSSSDEENSDESSSDEKKEIKKKNGEEIQSKGFKQICYA